MKTTSKLLLTVCCLAAFNFMNAQYLRVNGNVKDENGQAIEADYTLKNMATKLGTGNGSDLKLKVYFTGDYTLTFKKEGYESKTIYFSTFVNPKKKHDFNVNVILHKVEEGVAMGFDTNTHVTNVYYDGYTHAFSYFTEKN